MKKLAIVLFVLSCLIASVSFATLQGPAQETPPTEMPVAKMECNEDAQRGCCSWHGGVSHCGPNGYYICNDGTQSPSCRCY